MRTATVSNILDHTGSPIQRSAPPAIDPRFIYSQRNQTTHDIAEPYATHAWVHACVRAIAKPSAAVPKYITEIDAEGNDSDMRMWKHPVLSLLDSPNPAMSGGDLMECIYLALLLPTARTPGGQVFLYLDSGGKHQVDVRMGDIPMFIWPYSDNVVHPRLDDKRQFLGWNLVINGVKVKEFQEGEIIRIREYNPYNPLLGLSSYTAAFGAIKQDAISDKINTEYMQNSGALGGVLTTDSDVISRSEMIDFVKAFEDAYMGQNNAGRIAALSYGMKFDSFMKSNVDMQYIEMRKENRQRIQAAFGVNAEEIGVYESGLNRATAEQASRDVWQKTRLPLMSKVCEALNSRWVSHVDRGTLRLRHDLSTVDALRDVYQSEVDVASKMVTMMNVPPAEAARICGIPLDVDKYPHLNDAMFTPYVEPSPDVPADDDGKDEDDVAKASAAILERDVQRSIRNQKIWTQYVRDTLDPGEASMRRFFISFWRKQIGQIADNLDALVRNDKAMTVREIYMPDISAVLWNDEEMAKEMSEGYTREAIAQNKRAARSLKQQTNNLIDWARPPEQIQAYVANRRGVLQTINSTTSRDVYKVYNDISSVALQDSWTPKEFSTAVRESMNGLVDNYSAGRAMTTARTEIGSITQDYRQEAFEDAGVKNHEWITARDNTVRDSHQIEGQTRPVDGYFTLANGAQISYPLAPDGDAGDVINCRCLTIPVFKGDEA